ncbi:MAG: hypothetical protein J6T10_27595 [Methanobrevibacter sp.]|nr:hypothetical protein [Methanobrevibacter sp.]
MIIKGLKFVQTCFACPEQYDVFDSKQTKVGYVRLRWGNLTAECPDCGGEYVYEHSFEDSLKGCFSDSDERKKYLELIADCILISKRS